MCIDILYHAIFRQLKLSAVSKKFKINLEGQNYVHFEVTLSRNVKIIGIMASLWQIGKK